jgi:hypothetical protein
MNPAACGFVALIFLLTMPGSRASDAVAHTIGEAYDLNSERHLYSETHCVTGDPQAREVIYRDTDDRLIARKILNYRTGSATPSYVQHNLYAGESIAVEVRQEDIDMTVRDRAGTPRTVTTRVDARLPLVIDAGFDAFVRSNWEELVAGQSKRFQFPFAARESLVELRISAARCSYEHGTDQCFRLELDNWLLKMLVDPIELGYDAGLKRLARYRGLSNIGDGRGEGQVVDIRYGYEDLPAMACYPGLNG